MKVFCIIPALNEEEKISEVLHEVKKFVDTVVLVDDGSSDNTYQRAKNEGVVVLQHIINRGQGASLETGNKYALRKGADIIVHIDADGQFLAHEIKEVVEPLLNKEVDVVLGSRFLGKESNMPWFKKNILFPVAHLVNRIFLGKNIGLTDPQSGFRAMTREAWEKINIEQDGMAHASEILHKIYKNNLKVKEVPIKVIYHHFGQRLGGGVRIVKDLIIAKLMD